MECLPCNRSNSISTIKCISKLFLLQRFITNFDQCLYTLDFVYDQVHTVRLQLHLHVLTSHHFRTMDYKFKPFPYLTVSRAYWSAFSTLPLLYLLPINIHMYYVLPVLKKYECIYMHIYFCFASTV